MPTLVVVNTPRDWPFHIPGVDVVAARSYLTSPEYGELRGARVYNLCRSYRYQSTGYYVTLLATARGHRPLPSIGTIQDLKSQTMARIVSEDLDDLIQQSLAPIQSNEFILSVYFGRNLAKRYDRLSRELFSLFQAPLLRARFVRNDKWQLRSIGTVSMGEMAESHWEFMLDVATDYFSGRRNRVRKRAPAKYDFAILVNPLDPTPPSDAKAVRRFVKAAEAIGLRTEIIGPEDYGRLGEFDALFIRETTRVNHHTYRFARRAAFEGLVVMDSPESIVKCTNKVFLAELLSRHRFPVPRTLVVHRENVGSVGRELGLPCVLKQPDSAFSRGVLKVETEAELRAEVLRLLGESDLVIAQEYLPTDFDWRIGVIEGRPLYACKYYMAHNHWQIYSRTRSGRTLGGRSETLPVELAPRNVVRLAVRTANLIGDGLYGVDLKQSGKDCYVIEINDNPSIDSGVEDAVLREELYRHIMAVFLKRIEMRKAGVIPG